ncbi:MAG: Polysaccharide deacetylase [Fibrobacteres bacterium]|nr:Polysaccharide deacetylase [Fibrobacterota bacterium]
MSPLKGVFLGVCRSAGLFRIARLLTRRSLRILCYHGFSSRDEHEFRPQLFMKPSTFRARLAYLRDAGYPVLDLGRALEGLRQGNLPVNPVVITVDDGFRNVRALALGILGEFSFPGTVYVTTYYVERNHPVFRLAVQYMFWKSGKAQADLEKAGLPAEAAALGKASAGPWDIIAYCEKECSEERRVEILRVLGSHLGVDAADLEKAGTLTLMDAGEVAELLGKGVDIQLHTHRHRLPDDKAGLDREIQDNRRVLTALGAKGLDHFCYPSGIWSRPQWPMLAALGVRSATTCEPGFNYPDTPPMGLRRFLDSEAIAQIEFEAELSGFLEIMRKLTGKSARTAALASSGGGNPKTGA